MKKYDDYSVDRKEYYERLIVPKNVSFFNEMMNAQKRVLPVDIPVVFRELNFGSNPKTVMAKFGEPRYIVEANGISSQIFFYKEVISNHKIITQLHFLSNEFFYACYTFRQRNSLEIMPIRKMLFEKYSRMNGDTAEKYDQMKDRDNNMISVHDNVNFNIVYLWGHEKVMHKVRENILSMKERESTMIRKKHEDLLNKL